MLIVATFYGKGVYFARDFAYSAHDQYSPRDSAGVKHVYQARVLTGEFIAVPGNKDNLLIDTPLKPGSTVDRYDSVVDNKDKPCIFVVFRDTQAYPEYLVKFI